jgi:hypothetical protein
MLQFSSPAQAGATAAAGTALQQHMNELNGAQFHSKAI